MSPLRKLRGRPADVGLYEAIGSLDGMTPGRRVVKDLEVKQLDGRETAEGLRPLATFGDLEVLRLTDVRDADLAPLAELHPEVLRLERVRGVDFGVLGRLHPGLRALDLVLDAPRDCVVPAHLTLPPSLEMLFISGPGSEDDDGLVAALLAAIDWAALSRLPALDVRADGIDGTAIEADLGFLRLLTELENLQITGVIHVGPGPSPLEPPFKGLSRKLKRVIVGAADPEAAQAAMKRHLGLPGEHPPIVARELRTEPADVVPPWTIAAPAQDDGTWTTYGSLVAHFDQSTEYDALNAARRRLRAADAALLSRLDFDPEAGGTTILASSREDLLAALTTLGIEPSQ
ncbi:MAG TPA: hypothetical protein VFG42_24075 [Baekduia sp.]|uniref:hypothetical protein n=1 Tax=Baekduia sp. TaxID=2600305 RepID=UPI002D76FCA5|nr:hypothetical protein [Baekduia sp.]HET6509892.1 hypothetical protein [Baekduia sp.]